MENKKPFPVIQISKRDRFIVLFLTTILSIFFLRPYISDLNVWRGDTFILNNDTKQGINAYKKATIVNPRNGEAYDGLGYFYFTQNKLDLAKDAYKKAIKYTPREPMNYYFIGFIYFKEKNYTKAIIYEKKAIEIKPDYLQAYNIIANSYDKLGKFKEAIRTWEKIEKIIPNSEKPSIKIKELEKKLEI